MTKADILLKDQIERIFREGWMDENPRPKYEDGVPAHTQGANHFICSYDLSKGEFPITTLRPIAWKTGIKEIMWIYQRQSSDLKMLKEDFNVHYWDSWESKDKPGTIGDRYGYTVAHYDLMNKLLDGLVNDPFGRRHMISLWQMEDFSNTDGLLPCAFLNGWNVRKGKDGKMYLDMSLIQRSGDLMAAAGAGNINSAQYAALLMMVARHCGYEPGIMTHYVMNLHIYDRHFEQAREMLDRFYKKEKDEFFGHKATAPRLILNPDKKDFYSFTIEDFTMENYEPMKPQLKLPLGI